MRNVCRLYGVKALDALPSGIRATALARLIRTYEPPNLIN